jgi:hypothetical protein
MNITWPGNFLLGASSVRRQFFVGVCNRNRIKDYQSGTGIILCLSNIAKNATSSDTARYPYVIVRKIAGCLQYMIGVKITVAESSFNRKEFSYVMLCNHVGGM